MRLGDGMHALAEILAGRIDRDGVLRRGCRRRRILLAEGGVARFGPGHHGSGEEGEHRHQGKQVFTHDRSHSGQRY